MLASQLREHIIMPTLMKLGVDSHKTLLNATQLLIMIAAHESRMGKYLKQVGGVALGIYQIEPDTHDDVYENYLDYRIPLKLKVIGFSSKARTSEAVIADLAGNLNYQTAIARTILFRDREALPFYQDHRAMAEYAKRVWNTGKGKATEEDYFDAYAMYGGK